MRFKFLFGMILLIFISACTEEQQNKLSRLGVTWLEGNYKVTYADGEHIKSWIIKDSKVTSEPQKGYYYFWVQTAKGSKYVQSPIARTYIEEL